MIPRESTWVEKARPGHTIEVTKVYVRWGFQMVEYKHTGVHNKRAQSHPTVSHQDTFLKRYKRIDGQS